MIVLVNPGQSKSQSRCLQFLEEQDLYESVAESSLREEVLGTLDNLVKDWVKKVGRAAELADSFVSDSNAKIFTFGSYRLGVHGPGQLILCACAAHVISTYQTLVLPTCRVSLTCTLFCIEVAITNVN